MIRYPLFKSDEMEKVTLSDKISAEILTNLYWSDHKKIEWCSDDSDDIFVGQTRSVVPQHKCPYIGWFYWLLDYYKKISSLTNKSLCETVMFFFWFCVRFGSVYDFGQILDVWGKVGVS